MSKGDVRSKARAIWGSAPERIEGVLHVMAVAREGQQLRVIRIGERSPKSPTDLFALEYARARADAIVLTGSVVRAEPTLAYDLSDPGLLAMRGEREPPLLVVLSQRGDLPAEHPIWQSWARPLIYTGRESVIELPARVEVHRADAPSPRDAITYLRKERGAKLISIEAGPGVAKQLYTEPCAIDELTLSIFEGELHPEARGDLFLSEDEIFEKLDLVHESRFVEGSGSWRFQRYRRR